VPDLEHVALEDGFVGVECILHHEEDGADHVGVHGFVLRDVHGLQDLLDAKQDEVKVLLGEHHVD